VIDVAVVGAGTVGLWLAGELRLAGASVVLIEQALERSPHSRGLNIHARTLEVLDMRGMADAHVSEGREVPTAHFAALSVRLDMSVLSSRFPFMLVLPQVRTEELFAERAVAMGADPPQGGQGLNLGVQDAMNLGWKLAAAVNGTAPAWLLDSYAPERRPVGASVIEVSRAQEELASATTPGEMAVRDLFAEILDEHPGVNRWLAERVSALAVTYASEEGSHPLAGHRAPDLQLDRRAGVRRLWELLRDGHFALLTRRDRRRHPQIDHPGVTAAVVLEEDAAMGQCGHRAGATRRVFRVAGR
jgi:2-polyprenyl-6-methoxyphenol hydroxylase-like FAD-dependent oxidoreductase